MSNDLAGFFASLPPEARRIVESLDSGGRSRSSAPVRQPAIHRGHDASLSALEEEILGGAPGRSVDLRAGDRMFEAPVREAPRKPRARSGMSSMIEAIEKRARQ